MGGTTSILFARAFAGRRRRVSDGRTYALAAACVPAHPVLMWVLLIVIL
jgi:hypothetical protein